MKRSKIVIGIAAVVLLGATAAASASVLSSEPTPSGATPKDLTPLAALDDSFENNFVAITPCRLVDTRQAVGALTSGTTRSYVAAGTTGFVPQGGNSGGCTIPFAANAIQVSITSVGATGNGYLRAYPDNEGVPNATFMNYTASFNATGAGVVPIDTDGSFDFKITNFQKTTHVVVDVSGYFLSQMYAHVAADGTLTSGSRVTNVAHGGTGAYTVTFNRDIGSCTPVVSPNGDQYQIYAFPSGTTSVVVDVEQDNGTDSDQIDAAFNLVVLC